MPSQIAKIGIVAVAALTVACADDQELLAPLTGPNNFGQSGVDPATSVFHPGTRLLVFAHTSGFGPRVARVATQHDFTCADSTDDTILCAGSNSAVQLGDGGI